MPNELNALDIRRRLGREDWRAPEPLGNDSWIFDRKDRTARIIVSYGPIPSNPAAGKWIHASISHRDQLPTYDELVTMHAAIWRGEGYAYQVFAPESQHVNLHAYALHLWGRLDGRPLLPEFGLGGSI